MRQEIGIVLGCDERQEWLLPWWWHHYSAHNSFPVLFVDFGMTPQGRAWCEKKGLYAPLENFHFFRLQPVADEVKVLWERLISSVFTLREVFFKKPFALLQSPFPLSLWLDLDCQVLGNLEPLFYFLHLGMDLCIRKNRREAQLVEQHSQTLRAEETSYNAGVIAFRKGAPFLSLWQEEVIQRNHLYLIDEQALARVLSQSRPALYELPEIYNWNPSFGANPEAVIVHFQGGKNKAALQKLCCAF